jgi:hypothetical protein
MTATVLERRLRANEIADRLLKRDYEFDKPTRKRFLDALIPVQPRPRK